MKSNELNGFDKTPCFTKAALRQLHQGSYMSLDKDIQNWIRKGALLKLKNGLYTRATFFNHERNPEKFMEYVANKLVQPSYISCDYVLQKYGLLTEAVYGITSVTIKSTRSFQNKLGRFKFYSISEKLFTGAMQIPYGNNTILMATKSKALFDYIYLRQYLFHNISKNEIVELRLNLDELTKADWRSLSDFFKLCGTKKMLGIYQGLKNFSK